MEIRYFQWPDYVVLAIVLAISAAIGFYYAFTGGKQKTMKEYLFADKTMHWFPVSCSLLASYISSITMVSVPGEIYSYGTIFMYNSVFTPIGVVIASKFYLPVFQQMKIISLFKWMEKRFGKPLKTLLALTNILNTLMYCGMVMYGPALAVSAVTGIDIWVAVFTVLGISILYTVLGGMKAVLMTDTLQLLVMFAGLIAVLIAGTNYAGGAAEVYNANKVSGRLDVLEPEKFTPIDPRVRHTLWNLGINSIVGGITVYGTSQTSVMRALSLRPSHRQGSYVATAGMSFLFNLLSAALGLVIYAAFKYCDPIKDGVISSKDQYYPLFVIRIFGHLPGLPGFILSAVFSGSLSTLSSMLSSTATIIVEDMIKPWKPNIRDSHATILNKVLAAAVGFVSVVFVLFAMNFGQSIVSLMITITGVFGGPSFGLFTMGIFLPFVNRRGAFVGYLFGATWGGLVGLGGLIKKGGYRYTYPVTTAGCNMTETMMFTNITAPVYDPASYNPQEHYRAGFDAIFDVSYAWVKFGGIIITMFFACIASAIFNCVDSEPEKVNHLLISPHVVKSSILPKSWRAHIDFSDDLLEEDPQSGHAEDITDGDTKSSDPSKDKEYIGLQEKTNQGFTGE